MDHKVTGPHSIEGMPGMRIKSIRKEMLGDHYGMWGSEWKAELEPSEAAEPKHLFRLGEVTLSSGQQSDFKIDCDALTDADLQCIAKLLASRLPPYNEVFGVPAGGLRLAAAMRKFGQEGEYPLLIVDDVLTTGASMECKRADRNAVGAVIFARGPVPSWITPLFTMTSEAAKLSMRP